MGAFSIFSTKKRGKSAGALPEPELNYYELLGRRMNRIKYVLLSALTIFVIIGITFHSDKLNMDNFRYMLKFLSIDMDSEIEEGARIEFDPAPGTKALTVNGDLAIADSNGLQVFDMSGERFLRERDFMSDAMCVKSGNNILLCDRGTQTVNAYTVYAKIYSYETPYPVYDMCASADSGRYAVITAANGYRSGIEVYDTEFRKIFDYYFADRYVSCIALSNDGRTAAACTVNNSQNGDYCGEMYIYDVSDPNSHTVREFTDEIPWKIVFRPDGGYMLMTNRSLWLFDPQGNEVSRVEYGAETIKGSCLTDGVTALTFDTAGLSNGTTVRFYDGSLKPLGSVSYSSDVSRTDIFGTTAYIHTAGTLHTVDVENGKELSAEEVGSDYVCTVSEPQSGRLIMIFTGKAVFRAAEELPGSATDGGISE